MAFHKTFSTLILSFALPCLAVAAGKPRVYTSRTEYEKALSLYNDQLASYANYRKKVDFYRNYKVPSRETWRAYAYEWVDYFQPLLRSHGIYFDNESMRYKPAVVPQKTIWVNLMPKPGTDYFVFVIDDEPIEEALYYATTFAFDEPGDPPIFREVKKKPRPKLGPNRIDSLPSSTRTPLPVYDQVITAPTERLPESDSPCDFFMMPDGLKYNRTSLEKNWHVMSDQQVFGGNFRACGRGGPIDISSGR